MKILMLTPYLPFPLYSGGQIRSYNLIKNLSQKHKITLFSFIRNAEEIKHIRKLKEFCSDVRVFIKRPPWSITSLFLSAISVYPLVVCMYLKKSLRKEIEKAIEQEHFDLIHAETFYVMPDIPANKIPTILVEQTIEYLVYQHFTESVKLLPLKWLMNFDVLKIRYWEKKFWQRATRVVAMSEADRKIMQNLIPSLSVDLVPNGVDTKFFDFKKNSSTEDPKIVLFVGNFKWLQNREAVAILVKEIWPKIKEVLPRTRLWIVGRFPTKEILNFSSSSIKISPDIDDIKQAYNSSDVLLAPIYGPGGTRYKILEAMAVGLPVVTTYTGIEGLGAVHGEHALIGTNPKDLSEYTIKLLTEENLYQKLVSKGRKLIEDNFSWTKVADKLDQIYEKALYVKKN